MTTFAHGPFSVLLTQLVFSSLFLLGALVVYPVRWVLNRVVPSRRRACLVEAQLRAQRRNPRVVFITGASSGLGRSLALEYSTIRGVELALCGRNVERLCAVADDCRALGATVHTYAADVCDAAAMARIVREVDDAHRIDLMLVNAGNLCPSVSLRTAGGGWHATLPEMAAAVYGSNLVGAANTAGPLIHKVMEEADGERDRKPQIAFVSSTSALAPTVILPEYGSSKSALLSYCQALRALCAERLTINCVCPGLIETPGAQNIGLKAQWPVLPMSGEEAALVIRDGVAADEPDLIFPASQGIMLRILGMLPHSVGAAMRLEDSPARTKWANEEAARGWAAQWEALQQRRAQRKAQLQAKERK